MNKKVNTIYLTDNFKMFKTLTGNRDVQDNRVQALINSISKNGLILNPIIVNENMEVIEGQGRLAACKALNEPIYYTIVEGLTINDCRTLNANMRNWNTQDFIISYAREGNIDYQRILQYSKICNDIRVSMFANGLYGGSQYSKENIANGNMICSQKTLEKATEALTAVYQFEPFIKHINGRRTELHKALIFCYYCEACNNERLAEALEKYAKLIDSVVSFDESLDSIEKIYNRNLKGKRVYLKVEWDKYLHETRKR